MAIATDIPDAQTSRYWMRRHLRAPGSDPDTTEGLRPGPWHLEAPVPSAARPFHHYQSWCGVKLGKYVPQTLQATPDAPEPADGDVCPDCLRREATGQPRAWRGRH